MAEPGKVKFGIPASPKGNLYRALDKIYIELFKSMGIEYESVSCVPSDCFGMLVEGIIDGEVARSTEYIESKQNFGLLVPTSVLRMDHVFLHQSQIQGVSKLTDLRELNVSVGFQHGYTFMENIIADLVSKEKLMPVIHWQEAVNDLNSGALDVYVAIRQVEFEHMKLKLNKNIEISDVVGPGGSYLLYPFLSLKRHDLRKQINIGLQTMHQSQRIYEILKNNGIDNYSGL